MTETWLPVKGYKGLYEVSDAGHVRSLHDGEARLLKHTTTPLGHKVVKLYLFGYGTTHRVHALVWDAFKKSKRHCVYHKDRDQANVSLNNLTSERSFQYAERNVGVSY